MKCIAFFTCLLATAWQTILAQQTAHFETTLYFEDAVGNRDSVVVGYDTLATNDIDPEFGEAEILSPFDSIFEVRAGTQEYAFRDKLSKKIINRGSPAFGPSPPEDCYRGIRIFIYVWAKHQPVKVWWDRTVFLEGRCYRASALLNHWLDELAGPISPDDIPPEYACLAAEDSIHFDMSEEHLLSNPLFDAFALIRLEKEVEGVEAAHWQLFGINGALLQEQRGTIASEVELTGLPPGIYQLLLQGSEGKRYWGRIVEH